jgi:hypothetical protein
MLLDGLRSDGLEILRALNGNTPSQSEDGAPGRPQHQFSAAHLCQKMSTFFEP